MKKHQNMRVFEGRWQWAGQIQGMFREQIDNDNKSVENKNEDHN